MSERKCQHASWIVEDRGVATDDLLERVGVAMIAGNARAIATQR